MMPNMMRHFLFLTALVLLAAAGCSGASPITVKGKVLYNGEPLAGADLEFVPEQDMKLGSFGGQTEPDGRFEIKIGKGTGMNAKPGRFVVMITKGKGIGLPPPDAAMNDEERVKAMMAAGPGAPTQVGSAAAGILPLKYASASTSPFKVDISDGANDLNPFKMDGPPLKKK